MIDQFYEFMRDCAPLLYSRPWSAVEKFVGFTIEDWRHVVRMNNVDEFINRNLPQPKCGDPGCGVEHIHEWIGPTIFGIYPRIKDLD